MKRLTVFLLCLALAAANICQTSLAAVRWPDNISISAEGGIVMDAGSGAVLYGKNIHTAYYPASITKILTALIVIENCNMDDMVTFSRTAVYSVESGSTSAGMDAGDTMTVRDCLYALVLRSANEVANALAEHTAGSIEAFAEMMNQKAASLGCTDSHFNNPSGLNDPNHYTSAYDMALIAQAAFQNDAFVTIDSTLYYDLPPSKRNPEGFRIYPGHRMLKKNTAQYYSGIIGGKTGYTSLAGNTLVTCAERNGMRLVAVVLNGHQTHYTDTKALLDFGFSNFRSLKAADLDTRYTAVSNDLTIAGLPTTDLSILHMQEDCRITLPNLADFSDAVSDISYELPAGAPESAIARITYEYDGRTIGAAYLMHNRLGAAATSEAVEVSSAAPTEAPAAASLPEAGGSEAAPDDSAESWLHIPEISFEIPASVKIALAAVFALALVTGGLLALKFRIEKREAAERALRYERRQKRLQDIGMSTADFDLLLEKKRYDSALRQSRPRRRPRRHASFLDKKH
ncbi:MAG: D-alanyl-D-alanine carboxypeptidase family protein [Eubacteriales bacterium]|nr:D-alanyl-D-alanine carboxypeptidase family protein [Eubacteriales bacterium]